MDLTSSVLLNDSISPIHIYVRTLPLPFISTLGLPAHSYLSNNSTSPIHFYLETPLPFIPIWGSFPPTLIYVRAPFTPFLSQYIQPRKSISPIRI